MARLISSMSAAPVESRIGSSLAGDVAQERVIVEIAGSDLEALHPQIDQHVDAFAVERRGKELDAVLTA